MSDVETDETFNILIATDIHLGFMEKDAVRGNDSFVTFEEILKHAVRERVDSVLLGGDLFHENKPSRFAMNCATDLLRKYCTGNKPVEFDLVSDPKINFPTHRNPTVNFKDPHINIAIPVFSIHGNHDDPAGKGNLCAIDVLASAGLLNHFGKSDSLEEVTMSPVLLQKGATRLALYGLGSIRDERLHRLFVNDKVTMLRPAETPDDWFSLLVLHQNHGKHSDTNYIPEQFLDDFLDLVFWGHEHECLIEPQYAKTKQDLFITQPGSSVATSLSEGEAKRKHIGLLSVHKKRFKLKKIPLTTVRQFYIEDIVLSQTTLDPTAKNAQKNLESYIKERVETILEQAEIEHMENDNSLQPEEPLIRLRLEYTGFEPFNVIRFSNHFTGRVANPRDMIKFHRKKLLKEEIKTDVEAMNKALAPVRLDAARVEDMVKQYFANANKGSRLALLTERGLGEAVQEFVDKEEKDAIPELVNYQIRKTQTHLKQREAEEEVIEEELEKFKEERRKRPSELEEQETQEALSIARKKPYGQKTSPETDQTNSSVTANTTRGGRGRGRGRGRGAASTSTRGGRGKKTDSRNSTIQEAFSTQTSRQKTRTTYSDSDSDEADILIISEDEEVSSKQTKKTRGGKRGGVLFDDQSDDDEAPPTRRKRKR
ncbi:double-strand break repair protein MRE11-like [Tubulanus polymorphus]|uniref:double-strand break repair protein MRE11-like n=1 Tax=Tubulanus polymorphus TaxID=672921 RepID=UPI003DA35FEC